MAVLFVIPETTFVVTVGNTFVIVFVSVCSSSFLQEFKRKMKFKNKKVKTK